MMTRSISLLALTVASMAGASPAFAQSAPDSSAPAAGTQEDSPDIVLIGTRRLDRTSTTTASPVDIISADELNAQSPANVIDQIKNIVPSFFVGQNTISDASTIVRAPSLRGLPSDNVLVMLNGKRYNRSALVQVYGGGDTGLAFGSQGSDIAALPSIGIKSLQILRDGATAQYGTDAIAGVMNFGLRDDKGIELIGRYGQYYDGDGDTRQIAGNVGFGIGSKAFINISGEYFNDLGTSRGSTRPNALRLAQSNPTLATQIPNYPGPAQIWGSSPTHGYKFLVNSAYDVTDNSKIYFFVNVAHAYVDESFNYRPVNTIVEPDSNGVMRTLSANIAFRNTFYLTPCPAGNATCPAGGFVKDTNTFQYTDLYPAGFTPRFVGQSFEQYGSLGYKGDLGGLHYDLSGNWSRNMLKLSMYDSLNPSYGEQTQTSFYLGKLVQKEWDANLDLSYPLEVGLASPVTLSGGFEYRKETYQQQAGDEQSYGLGPYAVAQQLYTQVSPGVYTASGSTTAMPPGASGYGGTSPAAAGSWSQTSYGFYGDIEGDLVKGFSLGLAGRYEHYDTFGDAWVGKVSALWEIIQGLTLRGTFGTGYHAPSPGQSNTQILTTTFNAGNQVQSGTYPVNSPVAQYYGATTLSPEKSTNAGVGVVIEPIKNTTLTVDFYSIKVRDRIGISQPFAVTAADVAAQPALAAVGVGGQVNYFTNGYDTLTHGIDVVGTYRTDLAGATLNLTAAYNYNKSTVSKYNPAVISLAQRVNVSYLAPNHRANVSANLAYGPWSFNVRENYYGQWRDEVDYPSGVTGVLGQKFGDKFVTDVDFSLTLAKHYTLTFGASNLFDTRPDKLKATQSVILYPSTQSLSDGSVYPRSGGPFGINGGLWYARFRVKY